LGVTGFDARVIPQNLGKDNTMDIDYDSDGLITESGIYLNFGNTRIRVAKNKKELLAAMTNYNERNNKHFYLTLYQDGSGYIGEDVGIHSEIAFEFQNVNELFKKLNG